METSNQSGQTPGMIFRVSFEIRKKDNENVRKYNNRFIRVQNN